MHALTSRDSHSQLEKKSHSISHKSFELKYELFHIDKHDPKYREFFSNGLILPRHFPS